jgi:FkbM family methyltransferase
MADAIPRPMHPMLSAVLMFLRACVRSLRTDRDTLTPIAQLLRGAAMVPPFGMLLIILRIRAWLYGPIEVVVTASTGDRFRCRPPDLIQMYLWLFDIWEPDLTSFIRERLRPGDGFIDVGANIGYFSALAARQVAETGKVVAIEASPAVFASLAETVCVNNRAQTVRCVNKAAAAAPGEIELYAGPDHNIGLTTTVKSRGLESQGVVEALPLDDLLTSDEVRIARLVKIDVEGAEDEVLQGMHTFLEKSRNDVEILIELSPTWWRNETARPIDVLQPFFDAGMHAYEMENNYWPWRYLWPRYVRRPRRCVRDLTQRVHRLDLVMSRRDDSEL